MGTCPICGKEVKRYKFNYGCSGYKEGCNFRINLSICGRNISVNHAKQLLTEGKTTKIQGFTSKNGKSFDAVLKLEDGKCVFDFNN